MGTTKYDIKNFFTGLDTAEPVGTISGAIDPFDAKYFSADLRNIIAGGLTPKIVLNSAGGSVFAGMEIIDAMLGSKVNTHVAGMAFSMAGVILLFGEKRTMNDFAMLMIHKASSKDKNHDELLEKVNVAMEEVIKNRTSLTATQISDIFVNGKDLFFSAEEALSAGLIDEIVSTKIEARYSQMAMYGAEMEFFTKCVSQLEIENKSNFRNMDNEFKEVKAYLGLDSSDNERTILNSLKTRDIELGEAQKTITAKGEEIEGLKGKITSMNETRATELVDGAVKAGKIKAEGKVALLKMANVDFDGAKTVIDNMEVSKVTTPTSITANMGGAEGAIVLEGEEALLKVGYSKLASEHPEKLKAIAEEQPELFDKLIDHANQKTV